jgi:hypothetical protein
MKNWTFKTPTSGKFELSGGRYYEATPRHRLEALYWKTLDRLPVTWGSITGTYTVRTGVIVNVVD